MKIAIPLDENRQDVCIVAWPPYFLFREDGMDTVLENPAAQAQSGAGIQAAQFLVDQRADVLITVRCGTERCPGVPGGGNEDPPVGPQDRREDRRAGGRGAGELTGSTAASTV